MHRSVGLVSLLLLGLTAQACTRAVDLDAHEEQSAVSVSAAALEAVADKMGVAESAHDDGVIDRSGAFFQPIGAIPGRTCEHCHFAEAGWSLTPALVEEIFDQTDGLHPMFQTHDMGSYFGADVSTLKARRETYKTALKRGLTRFTGCDEQASFPFCLPFRLPRFDAVAHPDVDFDLIAVADPTGFSTPQVFSLFRRPVPTANSSLVLTLTSALPIPSSILGPFSGLAAGFHLFATQPTAEQVQQLEQFQAGHYFAQSIDAIAGPLDADGATGGPEALRTQPFYPGINDVGGHDPTGAAFDPWVFSVFDAWSASGETNDERRARSSIARGQDIFNFHPFDISGVNGFNDVLGVPTLRGTCSSCHNAPNVGSNSAAMFMDISTGEGARGWQELPTFTVRNRTTGQTRQMADLGFAMVTGHWTDLGKFRVPALRGMAMRAPYFHDGSAATVEDAVDYHVARFGITLSNSETKDLVAFLKNL